MRKPSPAHPGALRSLNTHRDACRSIAARSWGCAEGEEEEEEEEVMGRQGDRVRVTSVVPCQTGVGGEIWREGVWNGFAVAVGGWGLFREGCERVTRSQKTVVNDETHESSRQ